MKQEVHTDAALAQRGIGIRLGLTIELAGAAGDVVWSGTREQIEAESVLPSEVTWPEGFHCKSWEEDGWGWRLSRERPQGARGPRKTFLDVDNWRVRRTPCGLGTWHLHALVLQKRRELAAAEFEASDAGRDARMEQFYRAHAAKQDARFQQVLQLLGTAGNLS